MPANAVIPSMTFFLSSSGNPDGICKSSFIDSSDLLELGNEEFCDDYKNKDAGLTHQIPPSSSGGRGHTKCDMKARAERAIEGIKPIKKYGKIRRAHYFGFFLPQSFRQYIYIYWTDIWK